MSKTKKIEDLTQFNFKLDTATMDQFRSLCEQYGMPASEAARRLMREAINNRFKGITPIR